MKNPAQLLFPALFHIDNTNTIFVEFPDLVGCFTQGDSLTQAYFNAQEVLAIYAKENALNLPSPSELTLVQKNNPNTTVLLIGIDSTKYIVKSLESVKKTLSIPKWLNDLAVKYDVNFSKILKNALISYLINLDEVTDYDKKVLGE